MIWAIEGKDAGDFAGGALAWDVMKMTSELKRELPEAIDLSGCWHLKSYSLACLAALGAYGDRRIPLRLPNDQQCRNHCLRLGLDEWFVVENAPEIGPRATNVPITQLVGGPTNFSNKAIGVWVNEIGADLPAGLRPHLENHLDEIILNALGHSGSSVGCFVAGQGYPGAGAMDVAIVDFGITIRGHLARHPKHREQAKTDEAAIELARVHGVTGTPPGEKNLLGEPNSGVGLTSLYDFCVVGNGDLAIVSGNACVSYLAGGKRVLQPFRNPFPGTMINVRFRT